MSEDGANLSLPAGVTVLTGAAGAGTSSAALDLYRRSLDEVGRPGCLLIVPNAPAAAQTRRRLLDAADTGVLIGPAVTTFAALAARILAAAGAPPRPLRAVQRHLLLVRIIAELAEAGRLKALAPLADAPGLTGALDRAIAELKRAAVAPEALAKAIDPGRDKDADLLAVYRRYQQALRDGGCADVEGQMWLARDVLRDRPDAPLGHDRLDAVAADGFTDFTPTQLEILAALSRRAATTLITLPLGADAGRQRLWFWTRRTLERIRRAMPDTRVVAMDGWHEPLTGLFDLSALAGAGAPPKRVGKAACGPAITVLDAPDVEAEVAFVARAVKADLAGGAAGGSVAVLARRMEPYAEPIERIFAAHDVPVAPAARRLDAVGAVRYVRAILSTPPEYPFGSVLAAIKSSYFRPAALGEFDAATVATAEMTIRAANVLGGRDAYGRAFARHARRARARGEDFGADESVRLGPLAADAGAIERAGALVEALLSRLDRLGAARDAGSYARAVRDLLADLEVAAAAADGPDDATVAADLRALEAFDALLDDFAAAGVPGGAAAMPGALARAAAVAACPPARPESLVAVMDVLDARALQFDKVYLLGVTAGDFPHLAAERCFIGEADRAAWARRGVQLDRRSDLVAREMLLFYLAATRARASLTVSYVTSDAGGSDHAASAFIDELRAAAAAGGLSVAEAHVGAGEFVPPIDALASPADALNAAVSAAFAQRGGSDRRAAALLGWAGEHCPERLERVASGIFAAHRRWRAGPPDAFDGRLDDPAVLADLAARIPAEWCFSATELNAYAACPWQFFARYLLKLDPLIDPAPQLAPAARGLFCHAVLWRVMTALRDRDGGPADLTAVEPDDLRALLAEAVAAEKRRLDDRAVYSHLWDAQARSWEAMLWTYLAAQKRAASEPPDPRGLYFELAFGRAGGRDEDADPASRPEPLAIDAGGVTLRLAGKIDRVDRVGIDDGPALLAVDYKTGAVPAAGDIAAARDVQLALYARALAGMFPEPVAGGAYHGVADDARRYFASFKMTRGGLKPVDDHAERLERAMATVGAYVRSMAAGRFDALPERGCPRHCAYRHVCQYAEHRAARKADPSEQEGGDE